MNDKIDICMTATIRPEIVDSTLKSFSENMFKDQSNYRLIINVDPIGENIPQKSILKVAKRYFDDIIYNYPKYPSFTKAVIWCWSQTTSNYVFHLEDDWKLLTPIDINSMIEILEEYPDLVSLRLNKEKTGNSKHTCRHGFIYHPKISLNPTLFKGEFIRVVSTLMDKDINPEKQLRAFFCRARMICRQANSDDLPSSS